jgi:transglutaminase/protease-like cytokinesis protein 3
MKRWLLGVMLLSYFVVSAQQTLDYSDEQILTYVKSVGRLDSLNAGTISQAVTKPFTRPRDKVKAIYDWIALNIAFDVKAGRTRGNEKTDADVVLKTRKATAAGFAALFQDMCSVQRIRCLTVNGWAKQFADEIGEVPDEFNHTWAVIQLGQSPETWYYVDPTWGAGYTDKDMKVFTPAYTPSFFFPDRAVFNLQHYPDNGAWQLGAGPKKLKDFYALPVVHRRGVEAKLDIMNPNSGSIKAKVGKPQSFSFRYLHADAPAVVAVQVGPERKRRNETVSHTYSGGLISFNHIFKEEDEYAVTILVNQQAVLTYFVSVTE